jgi:hypothetical protein
MRSNVSRVKNPPVVDDHGVFTVDDDVRTLVDANVDHGTRTLDDDATLDEDVDHGLFTLEDLDLDHGTRTLVSKPPL